MDLAPQGGPSLRREYLEKSEDRALDHAGEGLEKSVDVGGFSLAAARQCL
ncbi:hypothetical protein SAMN05444339_105293 [Loktanella atrilutea]|uniref:Uncharacterized protein n=1 Tax=Loktanella atrilutea TaxID=366533 RepID=A0A1M5B8X0_LOKAT|nr:hypothetical protein SAMN05444339_105293 [Loktanella atrilutea]